MKKRKWRIILPVAMAAIFAANHAWYHFHTKPQVLRQAGQDGVPVVTLGASAAGHSSIELDEQSLANRDFLHFATLESWAFNKDRPPPCPQSVTQADGKQVKMMGFMSPQDPSQQAGNLKMFCLARSTQTCCYGPRPQYNQYVFVEMPEPVKFERLAPVVVEGKFVVDPKPAEGYIYRLEGKSVRAAGGNDEPPSAEEFAKQNNLPVFDFSPLEAARTAEDKEAQIAKLSAAIDGKEMVVHGYIIRPATDARSKDAPARIMLGNYAWDISAPPTLYNALWVTPRDANQFPPLWWPEAVFKGTAHVTKEASDRPKNGIVQFDNASLALAAADGPILDIGPYLPTWCEWLIAAAYFVTLAMGLISKTRAKGTV